MPYKGGEDKMTNAPQEGIQYSLVTEKAGSKFERYHFLAV